MNSSTDTAASARPNRWLALVVRYWAVNMTMIHDRGSNWPGFGYSDAEKDEMRALAAKVPDAEFFWFAGSLTVVAISIFAVIVTAGMSAMVWAIGGKANMPDTPAATFFLGLAMQVVVSFALGLPAAMLICAALIGGWYAIPTADLPDRATTARYFHKLWFQITRMSLIMIAAVLPLWIFVPADSKFMVMVKMVVPVLGPTVSVLTTGYYFSARMQRKSAL
jgi:hypothetical protein